MPFLQVSNATLYYDIFEADFTATSPPVDSQVVLLIHGFAGTPESEFAGQIPHLRARYRLLAPHLHGYGRSTQRTSYTVTYYREDVADMVALLDALGIDRVLVLGFSDGGIVGLLLAALHPQRVSALAVLGAQPSIDAQNVASIRHWLLEVPLPEEWQAQLAQLHGEPYWRLLPSIFFGGPGALVFWRGVFFSPG